MTRKYAKALTLSALLSMAAGATVALAPWSSESVQAQEIMVYKSPTCGCCTAWIEHMEENGFQVRVQDVHNLNPIKHEAGLTPGLASCHTAFVDGYVIEGHVPAGDVRRLLKERPQARGLAVPGMPVGSPGMEVAGQPVQPYDVVLFHDGGRSETFSRHP